MNMSLSLRKYLARKNIAYDIVPHRHTETTMNSVTSAHINAEQCAKSVILDDGYDYIMAVVPANRHVNIGKINRYLGRSLHLATEEEVTDLFADCEPGAIPPVGQAYGMETMIDDSLTCMPDVYLEAGNHEDLLHLKGSSYKKLMRHAHHATIC